MASYLAPLFLTSVAAFLVVLTAYGSTPDGGQSRAAVVWLCLFPSGLAFSQWLLARRYMENPLPWTVATFGAALLGQLANRFVPELTGDTIGNMPIGVTLRDNLIKECAEEASIPAALARQARPVGAVAYLRQDGDICDDQVLFNYDLVLPTDFTPINADGEVAGFELWPLRRVKDVLAAGDDFLFDVALSLIDFLIRHGVVGPADPDYIEIAEGLWSVSGEGAA